MDRREFLGMIAGGLLAAPRAGDAQPGGKAPRIGVLGVTPSDPLLVEAFAKGLSDAGYLDSRNVTIEHRHAGGKPDQLPALAADLVRAHSDVLFARGAGALAAM